MLNTHEFQGILCVPLTKKWVKLNSTFFFWFVFHMKKTMTLYIGIILVFRNFRHYAVTRNAYCMLLGEIHIVRSHGLHFHRKSLGVYSLLMHLFENCWCEMYPAFFSFQEQDRENQGRIPTFRNLGCRYQVVF